MERIDKTVFMSYRRTNASWALAIYKNLAQYGFDVFFDFSGIYGDNFEQVMLENIRARMHFLILLTPSALERCSDPGDLLRREIETAMDSRRNVVPLMLEGFDFSTPAISSQLTGKLAKLKYYNALRVPAEYFDEAMERLRARYLSVSVDAVLHPPSPAAQRAVTEQKDAAGKAPAVTEEELTAQQWFERGFDAADPDEQIRFYTQAIRLKPDYAEAFINRGLARQDKGDLEGALKDYDEAIRLQPDDAEAFYNKGLAWHAKGDLGGAIADYNEAIRLKPDYADAFINRGVARSDQGDLEGALQDYTQAIRLRPDDADAFNDRGIARRDKGDLEGAIEDFNRAIALQPDLAQGFKSRGDARYKQGDLEGALQDYDEAVRLKPDYAKAFYNRSLVRRLTGDEAAALQDENEAIRLGYKPQK